MDMGLKHARLSEAQQIRLLECFVRGVSARAAAIFTGVNKNTCAYFYYRLRKIIFRRLDEIAPIDNEIELRKTLIPQNGKAHARSDQPPRVPLFGINVIDGKIHSRMIRLAAPEPRIWPAPSPVISMLEPSPHLIFYVQGPAGTEHLSMSDLRRCRVHQAGPDAKIEVADEKIITRFWNHAKRNLKKYRGIPKYHFPLFLKECEFRFNYAGHKNMLSVLHDWVRNTTI
jgi:transposase